MYTHRDKYMYKRMQTHMNMHGTNTRTHTTHARAHTHTHTTEYPHREVNTTLGKNLCDYLQHKILATSMHSLSHYREQRHNQNTKSGHYIAKII